jgi:hypothetical protein
VTPEHEVTTACDDAAKERSRAEHRASLHVFPKTRPRFSTSVNQDSAHPKGRFSRSTQVTKGGIVWPLDGLSNRDEVPNNELRLRRVDENTYQRLLETAC